MGCYFLNRSALRCPLPLSLGKILGTKMVDLLSTYRGASTILSELGQVVDTAGLLEMHYLSCVTAVTTIVLPLFLL